MVTQFMDHIKNQNISKIREKLKCFEFGGGGGKERGCSENYKDNHEINERPQSESIRNTSPKLCPLPCLMKNRDENSSLNPSTRSGSLIRYDKNVLYSPRKYTDRVKSLHTSSPMKKRKEKIKKSKEEEQNRAEERRSKKREERFDKKRGSVLHKIEMFEDLVKKEETESDRDKDRKDKIQKEDRDKKKDMNEMRNDMKEKKCLPPRRKISCKISDQTGIKEPRPLTKIPSKITSYFERK